MSNSGEAFKQLLIKKGISQYKLGKITNIDKSTLSKIATGKTTHPTSEIMQKISEALEISIEDLINILKTGTLENGKDQLLFKELNTNRFPDMSVQKKRNYEILSKALYQNLPPQQNKFIGRFDQIKELMERLSPEEGGNMISVDGIGGVGKTALVIEAAYQCLEFRESINSYIDYGYKIPYFDVIIFVSAKESILLPTGINYLNDQDRQHTLNTIINTIIRVLDPSILRIELEDQITKLNEKLRAKRVLLIIDNLETISDRSDVEKFLFRLPPGTKSVMTTREQLGYSYIRVDSLPKNDSIKLISQQLYEKKYKLCDADIEKLNIACAGIPLAIIHTICCISRGSSLYTVIEDLKSHTGDIGKFCFKREIDDLKNRSVDAYRLFLSISIFQNSPRLDAVIEVAGLNTKTKSSQEKYQELLQRYSLVFVENSRYKMISLIREYALAELASESEGEFNLKVFERWIQWYVKFGQRFQKFKKWQRHFEYDYLDDEYDNYLSVLQWCKKDGRYRDVLSLWTCINSYTNIRGFWKDRISWLKWLSAEATRRGDIQVKVRMNSGLGRILLLMGQPKELEESKKLLLDAWTLKDNLSFSQNDYITNHLAGLYIRLNQFEKAHSWLDVEQSLLDHEQSLDDQSRSMYKIYIHRERAEVYFYQKKYINAKEHCNLVINLANAIENQRSRNYAQRILANIYIIEGDFLNSELLLKLGYDEVTQNKDVRRMAYYQYSFCMLEKAKGNIDEAKYWADESCNNFQKLGMFRDADIVISLITD